MFEDLKVDALENRRFIRAKYVVELNCIKVEDDETNIILNTSNISLGGIAAVCQHEIKIGTSVKFILEIEGSHHDVTAQIIYCAKQGENYKIGLEFLNPKPVLIDRIKRLAMKQANNL